MKGDTNHQRTPCIHLYGRERRKRQQAAEAVLRNGFESVRIWPCDDQEKSRREMEADYKRRNVTGKPPILVTCRKTAQSAQEAKL